MISQQAELLDGQCFSTTVEVNTCLVQNHCHPLRRNVKLFKGVSESLSALRKCSLDYSHKKILVRDCNCRTIPDSEGDDGGIYLRFRHECARRYHELDSRFCIELNEHREIAVLLAARQR